MSSGPTSSATALPCSCGQSASFQGGSGGSSIPPTSCSRHSRKPSRPRRNSPGRPEAQVLGYLRRALTNNLIDAARKFAPAKGELSPDAAAQSSLRLADWIAADHTSPSERADRGGAFNRLAEGLAKLPDCATRRRRGLRYLQGMKVTEIARILGKSEGAVSQLLHRGVSALRVELSELDS